MAGRDPSNVDDRLDELLRDYGAFLRHAIRRLCPSTLGVTADEIEQDARIRLWHALRQERNITDPASYLYRVAASAAIDAVRRVRARRETQMDHPAGPTDDPTVPVRATLVSPARSPEELAVDRQTTGQIGSAIARLAVNRRRAVGLHLRGFNSTEIARLLGWTEPKARNLTHRGLNDLREILRREGIDFPENTR